MGTDQDTEKMNVDIKTSINKPIHSRWLIAVIEEILQKTELSVKTTQLDYIPTVNCTAAVTPFKTQSQSSQNTNVLNYISREYKFAPEFIPQGIKVYYSNTYDSTHDTPG